MEDVGSVADGVAQPGPRGGVLDPLQRDGRLGAAGIEGSDRVGESPAVFVQIEVVVGSAGEEADDPSLGPIGERVGHLHHRRRAHDRYLLAQRQEVAHDAAAGAGRERQVLPGQVAQRQRVDAKAQPQSFTTRLYRGEASLEQVADRSGGQRQVGEPGAQVAQVTLLDPGGLEAAGAAAGEGAGILPEVGRVETPRGGVLDRHGAPGGGLDPHQERRRPVPRLEASESHHEIAIRLRSCHLVPSGTNVRQGYAAFSRNGRGFSPGFMRPPSAGAPPGLPGSRSCASRWRSRGTGSSSR